LYSRANHVYIRYTNNGNGTHSATCTGCTNVKTEDHTYSNGTCTATGCGATESTGEEECEHFSGLVEDMIDFVKEHDGCFDWGDPDGDLESMILFLICNREDANIFYIEEKDSNDT